MASKYMFISGIPGESVSYPQTIEVESLSYEVSQRATQSSGSGLVAGGANLSSVSFTKEMDKSTPLLFFKLCSGEPIDEVTFILTRAGGQSVPPPTPVGQLHPPPPNPNFSPGVYVYCEVVCRDVLVTSYSTSGHYGPGNRPMESLTFSVGTVTEDYVDVDKNGLKKSNVHAGYNFMSNAKV